MADLVDALTGFGVPREHAERAALIAATHGVKAQPVPGGYVEIRYVPGGPYCAVTGRPLAFTITPHMKTGGG